ncbi:MAG: hypothetical protein ACQESP_07415 [Candidatus Muiribacteriota bacterium]
MKIFKNRGKIDYFLLFIASVLIVFVLVVFPQYDYIKQNVQNVSCQAVRRSLKDAVDQYNLENKGKNFLELKEIDVIMLKEENYTADKFLTCPDGGVLKINMHGDIYCTLHNPEKEDE